MEAANNQAHASLSSSPPASGGADAMPLKLHFEKLSLEVAVPREMGGELTAALQRALERFSDVMERWLDISRGQPGSLAPPPMPWLKEAPRQPQQSAALPPAAVAPAARTPVAPINETPSRSLPPAVPARERILPEEVSPLLIEDWPPLPTAATARETAKEDVSAGIPAQSPLSPSAIHCPATSTVEKPAEEALLQLRKGERHRLAGRKKDALACYEEVLTLAPDCAQAYLGRASIYIEQGRFQEALLDCNSALRQQPERAVLYVLRGLVYARLGNLKRALEEAEDAIRFDPRLPSAYMLRGTMRFKKGMTDEALLDVKKAICLRPDDAKFRSTLARLLAETGQYEQAAHVYAKVLELAPDFHEVRLHRGTALRLAGETAQAEAELTEYLRRHPRTAAAHYQRGLCRLAQHNYPQAMADFDKALALDPNDKAAYQAKEKTLQQWEGTARQARAQSGSAATVAPAATAMDAPSAQTAHSSAFPSRPMLAKSRAGKPKPIPWRPWRVDYNIHAWMRPAKWTCALVLVGLLGFGGFRALANLWHDPYRVDEFPQASASLTADQLFERYKTDPDKAKAELSDHVLEVSGEVAQQLDDKSPPVIVLATTHANAPVKCTMKSNLSYAQQMQVARSEPKAKVTIVGTCAGTEGNTIAINKCLVVRVIRGNGRARR